METSRDAAFREFFAAEFPSAVRRARVIVQDPAAAEDVAAEAFARLYARWKHVSEYEQPAAWVRLVTTRLAVRAAQRKPVGINPVPNEEGREALWDLETAIRRLTTQQRAAVLLHYFDDLPVDEVASAMGCKESTAKVHLHRARKALRLELEEEAPNAAR